LGAGVCRNTNTKRQNRKRFDILGSVHSITPFVSRVAYFGP
jgi:hypothetical protein